MKRSTMFALVVVLALIAITATAMAALPRATLSMSRPLSGAVIAEDTTFTVSGLLKPRHSVTALPYTRVYFYRYHQGKYRLYTSRLARNSNTSIYYTKFSRSMKLPYNGKWYTRAYHKCAKHAASWSPARYFSVTGASKPTPRGAGCWSACH